LGGTSPRLRKPQSAMRASRSQRICSVSVEPTGSNCEVSASLRSRLPLWAMSQSRRPHERWNGWVFASVMAPQMAVRTCMTKMDDSSRSQAETRALRRLPCEGAASLRTRAAGSPPG